MTEAEIRVRLTELAQIPLDLADHRPAAVLVPLEPEHGVWLTRRTDHLLNHAGQVAFPGGRIEVSDATPEAAAIREAHEEIGLPPQHVTVLGRMDDFITGTGFHIAPVLALVPPGIEFILAPYEVAAVFCLPFEVLLDPAAPQRRTAAIQGVTREFWVWPHETHYIWGATAAILVQLARRLRGEHD